VTLSSRPGAGGTGLCDGGSHVHHVPVGAAVPQVGGHLQGREGSRHRCWHCGQDRLALGDCSQRSPRVPSCFLGSNADISATPPLPPQAGRARGSLLSAGKRRLPVPVGHHDLLLAGGPAAVGGGEDGGAALAVPGPPARTLPTASV